MCEQLSAWDEDWGKQTDLGEQVLALEMGRGMILPGQHLWRVQKSSQEGEEAADGPSPSRKEIFLLRGISKKNPAEGKICFWETSREFFEHERGADPEHTVQLFCWAIF